MIGSPVWNANRFAIVLFMLSFCLTTILAAPTNIESKPGPPLLLLLSYDGLRYDFISAEKTPNLYTIAKEGVWGANGILPQVDTMTAPNHQSIVTGLYEESHGIIGNYFYDPQFNENYDVWDFFNDTQVTENSLHTKWYNNVEPIWTANQLGSKTDIGRCSGIQHWPMGNANYSMVPPPCNVNGWKDYGNVSDWKREIDELIGWFTSKQSPINFGLYYNAQPDHAEHYHSVFSKNVTITIKQIDELTGYLIENLKSNGLWDKINLIFTADHGHQNVHGNVTGNMVFLDEKFPQFFGENNKYIHWSEHSFFVKPPLKTDDVYQALQNAVKNEGLPLKVFRKSDFPDSYHYKNNVRVGDILLFPQPHTYYFWNTTREKQLNKTEGRTVFGNHGYLTDDVREMRPFFIARGPVFKKNYTFFNDDVQNVDLYPLMCAILGVDPKPNNGSLRRIEHIFTDEFRGTISASQSLFTCFSSVLMLYLISAISISQGEDEHTMGIFTLPALPIIAVGYGLYSRYKILEELRKAKGSTEIEPKLRKAQRNLHGISLSHSYS